VLRSPASQPKFETLFVFETFVLPEPVLVKTTAGRFTYMKVVRWISYLRTKPEARRQQSLTARADATADCLCSLRRTRRSPTAALASTCHLLRR
jgi:hypothetical protein